MYVYSIDIANIEMQYIVNIWNFFELCFFIVNKLWQWSGYDRNPDTHWNFDLVTLQKQLL